MLSGCEAVLDRARPHVRFGHGLDARDQTGRTASAPFDEALTDDASGRMSPAASLQGQTRQRLIPIAAKHS
jgi:hypothetical protein